MRLFLAGLLLLFIPTVAFAQAKGEVESVGFNNFYRPDCWTPMVVRLQPQTNEPGTYQIQVWQYDVDGDRPVYTRQITLNGADQARDQRFWMYFLPQPINKGLPDSAVPGSLNTGTLKDLQHDLQVFLCTAGGKQIAQLPITAQLQNVDPFRDYGQLPRSSKLILSVSDGSSSPAWRDYQSAVGITEDVTVVHLTPRDLPEDPIGYEAVDGIVWLNADPADLDKGGAHKLQAITDYVKFGGHIVVCQPTTEWQKTLAFGDLLPVTVQGIGSKENLEPLRSMAQPHVRDEYRQGLDAWNRPVGPFQFARATAKPGTVVDSWIDWKGDGSYSDTTPFLVRQAYGLGQVTWIAQDLGNPAIAGKATSGWAYIWDKVFGWKNETYIPPPSLSRDDPRVRPRLEQYRPAGPVDLGWQLTQGLDSSNRAAWLIFIAVAFFIVYWIVAGPGGYLYLAWKKRAAFSWFFFGLAAIGATAVTALVVKLVVRGPPEIHHVSVVRIAPGQPALVYSRFGLYIPRDGDQTIQLPDAAHDGVSYVSGLAEHPQQLGEVTEFPAPADYTVPVRDLASADAPQVTVPYRSSAKKFQARWIGQLPLRISGSVKLAPDQVAGHLEGTLTNQTGRDLDQVYFGFETGGPQREDWLAYIPGWPKNTTLDLKKDFIKASFVGREAGQSHPGDRKVLSDALSSDAQRLDPKHWGWMNFWYGHFHSGPLTDANVEDAGYGYVFPMLSFFDRLPPAANYPAKDTGQFGDQRFEMFRRGGRILNASQSLMAGQLVILAKGKGPLPIPVEIDGDTVGGDGTILYQFLLPIDRGDADKPTTRASE